MLLINDLKSNNSTNKLFNYNYMLIINYVKSNKTCTFTSLKKLSTLTQLFSRDSDLTTSFVRPSVRPYGTIT